MAKVICSVFVALMSVVIIGCGDVKENKKEILPPQQAVKIAEPDLAFFEYLEKLSQDERQKQKYSDVLEKLTGFVGAEVKKNPIGMSSHIEEIIPFIPNAGPGAMLLAEGYASSVLREEMESLKKDNKNIQALYEKDKKIRELEYEIFCLKDKIVTKDAELERLKWKVEPSTNKGVPVAFHSGRPGAIGFKFVNIKSSQYWVATVGEREYTKDINLPTGEYRVLITRDGKEIKQERLIVTPEPSISYGNTWYHGFVLDRE